MNFIEIGEMTSKLQEPKVEGSMRKFEILLEQPSLLCKLVTFKRKKIEGRAWCHFKEHKKCFIFLMNFIQIGRKIFNPQTLKVR